MRTWALAVAALLLIAVPSAAQNSPPPTPILPCDSNAITGSRSVPPQTIPTASGNTAGTERRQTSISLSLENGATHYFVADREVPLALLGQAAAEAWLANSPGNSIEQCWYGRSVGTYTVAGRLTSICRIVIVADEGVRYGGLASARNALRDVGLTQFALMTPDQTRVVVDDHLPLNPVLIRLQGISPTIVRIMSPPDATEPVIGIVNESGWSPTPLARLGENLTREATRNNPALAAEELNAEARICVRPDSTISYGDVLRVLITIRDHGFRRVGLYSEAFVPVDDQGRQLVR
jgi:biopolymer transport protein ExbD